MTARSGKSRKGVFLGQAAVLLAVAGLAGFATLNGASPAIDPSRLADVEVGTMVKSVVATGKVEPITKVEMKSKANGIIKALHVDVDSVVSEGAVLLELDRDRLTAQLRGAEANLLAAPAAVEGATDGSRTSTGRSNGTRAASSRGGTGSTRRIGRRSRCGTPRSRRSCSDA
jgi:HlyD family secretion protein